MGEWVQMSGLKKGTDARACGRGVTATRWLKAWVAAVVFMAVLAMVDLLACGAACVFYPVRFYDEVTAASTEFGVEKTLIFAVINTESHFNARAKSGAGAMGLMQIMPKTGEYIAGKLGVKFDENDLFDPQTNIRFGAFYLKYLLNKFGDTDTALACYNAGEGNARAWFDDTNTIDIAQISFSETVHYIDKVNAAQKAYRARLRFLG